MKNLIKNYLVLSLFALILIVVACKKDDPAPTPPPATGGTTGGGTTDITKFSFAALSHAVDATIDATAKTIAATPIPVVSVSLGHIV